MSDVHRFERTFVLNGSPVQADPDLSAALFDPLGRRALEFSLSGGGITFDAAETAYAFEADLAFLPAGAVRAEWYARKDGVPLEPWPAVEIRTRSAAHEPRFGAKGSDVLERLRGLDYPDLAPVWEGAEGDGADALDRFLALAEGRVLAALPAPAFRLLTRRRELVTESAPGGVTSFPLCDIGEEVVSCSVFLDGKGPLEPQRYSLDGRLLVFGTPPAAGCRIEAELEYSGFAPRLLRDLAVAIAAAEAGLALAGAGPLAAAFRAEREAAMRQLERLESGSLLPDEMRRPVLACGAPLAPGLLSAGRFKRKK